MTASKGNSEAGGIVTLRLDLPDGTRQPLL